MDRWSRNERLYRHLLGLGLIVIPIFASEDRAKIDHLLVSVELPIAGDVVPQDGGEHAAVAGVVPPMECADVAGVVGAAEGASDNVVEFPSVL
jgi:hypothetical protein